VAQLKARVVHEQEQAQVTEEEHEQLMHENTQVRCALGVTWLDAMQDHDAS
jgi:hypothetical protein